MSHSVSFGGDVGDAVTDEEAGEGAEKYHIESWSKRKFVEEKKPGGDRTPIPGDLLTVDQESQTVPCT